MPGPFGLPLRYLQRLIPIARRLRIPLVIDAVEWYESSHLSGGRLGPVALANTVAMRLVSPCADGVIGIGRFLTRYFEQHGIPSLRVPPLFELTNGVANRPSAPLTLCYAGFPVKKDQQTLRNLVRLPTELGAHASDLRIEIVGVERDAARGLLGDIEAGDVDHESLFFMAECPPTSPGRSSPAVISPCCSDRSSDMHRRGFLPKSLRACCWEHQSWPISRATSRTTLSISRMRSSLTVLRLMRW